VGGAVASAAPSHAKQISSPSRLVENLSLVCAYPNRELTLCELDQVSGGAMDGEEYLPLFMG
jgi:hypothetical protein